MTAIMGEAMMFRISCALCAVAVSIFSADRALAAEAARAEATNCTVGSGFVSRVGRSGAAASRHCAVDRLENARYSEVEPSLAAVRSDVRLIADYYAARSERQQFFVDAGAFTTATGVLGYSLSGPAGVSTQSYWGYGALIPIILVQFNANEPTRDLFFAGRIGTDLISDRYLSLNRRLTLIESLKAQDASYRNACGGVEQKLVEVERWAASDDKLAILPTVTAVAQRCRALTAGWSSMDNLTAVAGVWKNQWARDLATDMVRLDDRLMERDNRLRTSPAEALTMLVSTSLRTLDTLVSGENAQAAIDSIEVQNALGGLGMTLSEVRLPPAPTLLDDPLVMSEAAQARSSVARTPPRRGAPAAPDVPGTVMWLRDRISTLEQARAVHNERVRWAAELSSAATTTQLDFSYSVANQRIEVVLRAPGGQLPSTQASRGQPG